MDNQHSIHLRRTVKRNNRGNPFRKVLLLCLMCVVFAGCNMQNRVPVDPESESGHQFVREVSPYHTVNCGDAVKEWYSYRLERGEILDVRVYAEGFIAGWTGPPGLVDGAPDYNLGHSDGMLAAMGRKPGEENMEAE